MPLPARAEQPFPGQTSLASPSSSSASVPLAPSDTDASPPPPSSASGSALYLEALPPPEQLPLPPTITPLPCTPTTPLHSVAPRADIVTISVTASSAASSSAAATTGSSFPFAVAIPALIGGMALAIAGAGVWWWYSRKKDRERRRRWEAAQRRQRKRANSAASRPSVGANRPAQSSRRSPTNEKGAMPPVPVLPKAYNAHGKAERGYGYANQSDQRAGADGQTYNAYQQDQPKDGFYFDPKEAAQFDVQPSIEHVEEDGEGGALPQQEETRAKSTTNAPGRPSRSTARVAAADNAAAREAADPLSRYRPNKPSPLALKAEEEKKAVAAAANSGYGDLNRYHHSDSDYQETLANPNARVNAYDPSGPNRLSAEAGYDPARVTSGEWGVALGSPNNDGTFAAAYGGGFQAQQQVPQQSTYQMDPYLAAGGGGNRAPSGQYTVDPYAGYHGGEGKKAGTGGGWV